jgi:hypothetical protein
MSRDKPESRSWHRCQNCESPYREVAQPGSFLNQLTIDDLFDPKEIKLFPREIGFAEQAASALFEAHNEKLRSYYDELRSTLDAFKGQPESATVARTCCSPHIP